MTRRPNILLILCDQLRHDAIGCSGDWVRTPHIDRLARQWTVYDSACPLDRVTEHAILSSCSLRK